MRRTDTEAPASIADEIARYLETGHSDPLFRAWPGHTLARCQAGEADLREALVQELRRRTLGAPARRLPANLNVDDFVRRKLTPMVRGLFPKGEQDVVLGALERGVCILTSDNVDDVLRNCQWPETAWTLTNMYLRAAGASTLDDHGPSVVGLSEETVSYVSVDYFSERDVFADFIVHEAAHACHNCKRETVGLSPRRRQPWLLDIAYAKRETFAYACEAYSRILELSVAGSDRGDLLEQLALGPPPPDERVELSEYLDIVGDACGARNGWKRILARCAPVSSSATASSAHSARLPRRD